MKRKPGMMAELIEINEQLKTEIRKHEETARQLTEQKQFLASIMVNAPIVIWSIDLEGIFTYSQFKVDKELMFSENIGKSAFDVYKGTEAETFVRNVLNGEILNDMVTLNGIIYDTRVSPLYDQMGNKTGYLGISLDITERVKTEKKLEKFRHVLDQAPGAVMIMDKNFNFEYINPHFTKISGYTPEELLTRNISDTLYHGKIPESRTDISKTMVEGKNWQGELYTRNKDGTWYWANTITAPFKNSDGLIDGFVIIQQDITEKKKMELILAEQEKLYRSLMEKSLDGIVISQDGKVIMVNKAFADMIGYTIDECIESFGPESIAPEDRERVLGIHYRRMKGEVNDMRYNAAIIGKNGERVVAEFNTTSIELNGKPASLVSTRDITERIRMQQALEQSMQKFRDFTEMLPQTVYELDTKGRQIYMNKAGLKAFGFDRPEPGKSVLDSIVPEDRLRLMENMQKNLVAENLSWNNEYKGLRTDGTTFPIVVYAAPVYEENELIGSRGIVIDISERKNMENALRESEEKYRTLIEKATDGILITQDGVFKFVNSSFCEMMQYSEEELVAMPFSQLVDPKHHEEMMANHRRRMNGESFQAIYRAELIRKDGKRIMVELNSRTTEFGGKPASFVITRDITDRLHTEQELKTAKEQLEKLNRNLEERIQESSRKLTEANTQLIRLQKEKLQSQFEVLRQQVNPHFLFNSLNVLTSLIKLEPDLAEKFTEHLSKVYRYVLENKDHDLVSLHTELEFLDAYIFLLHIRFMDKIEISVQVEQHEKEKLILPLALQLLIENAIKHNSMSKRNPLKIRIFITDGNVLNVVNNLQERESHMVSTGVGLKNIEHRYHLLDLAAPEFIKTDSQFIARVPLKG